MAFKYPHDVVSCGKKSSNSICLVVLPHASMHGTCSRTPLDKIVYLWHT